MNNINSKYIILKDKINMKDYNDINNLQKYCENYDQVVLKLELDYKLNQDNQNNFIKEINEFLYYDKDYLVGYIGICCFNNHTIEVNGMVHPNFRRKGIFKTLFKLVKDEWYKRKNPQMLLVCDNKSLTGLEFIKGNNASLHHSEHEMIFNNNLKIINKQNRVKLRKATQNDAKEIAYQNYVYFNIEVSNENISINQQENNITYIAEVEGNIIGKIQLEITEDTGRIYGFGVLPKYRNKGYGKEILMSAVEILIDKNMRNITLQVDTNNQSALILYKSCAFEELSVMSYFELNK